MESFRLNWKFVRNLIWLVTMLLGTYVAFNVLKPVNFHLTKSNSETLVSTSTDNDNVFNIPNIKMDDPRLIRAVRKQLVPPSTNSYSFSKFIPPGADASAGQLKFIIDILQSFGDDAFFLDCGAMDGETVSNTLFLEKTLSWRGLLIEANPVEYQNLISKNRKVWSANFCVSSTKFPKILPFSQSPPGYGMSSLTIFRKEYQTISVPCYPLYSVLLAVNRTTVDFFSFDVEGAEMDILNTIPFDKVIFKVLVIENIFVKGGKEVLREFMEANGYIYFGEIQHTGKIFDSVFIHHSVPLTKDQQARIGTLHRV